MSGTGIVGPSLVPTRYKVTLQTGESSHVRCGADLVLTGLNHDLDAEGNCPVCETKVRFRIANTKLEGLTSPGAVLHVVELPRTVQGRPFVECEGTNLFDSSECLRKWSSEHKGRKGREFTVQEYLDHLKSPSTESRASSN